jgi:hypothetical protein
MENLELEKLGVVSMDENEITSFYGGGLGPLWWNPMLRAGLLSRFIITGPGTEEVIMA